MSEVRICNLALSHLGESASVASINPPDNSVQAQLCAQFYPIARNSLLDMETWSFSTRRIGLAAVQDWLAAGEGAGCARPWRFAYAAPANMLSAIAVQHRDAPDDYEAWVGPVGMDRYPEGYGSVPGAPLTVPQPYEVESNEDGSKVILTNVPDAVLRFTALVSDTTKFGPLFSLALSHLLASMLAGPVIKGDTGIQVAEQQLKIFDLWRSKAATSDANQRKTRLEPSVPWIRGR